MSGYGPTVAALLLLTGLNLPPGGPGQGHPAQGRKAPDVAAKALDGSALPLRTGAGKALLLLWVKDDLRSRQAVAELGRVFADSLPLAGRARVVVIFSGAVDRDKAVPVLRLTKAGLPFAAAFDPGGKAWDAFKVLAVPTVDLLDKDNRFLHREAGHPQDYQVRITRLLNRHLLGIAPPAGGDEGAENARTRGGSRTIAFARILIKKGRTGMARKSLEKGLRRWPEDTELAAFLGFLLLRLEDPAAARIAFQTLLKHHPESPRARAGLAGCLLLEGKKAAAKSQLEDLLVKYPHSPHGHYFTGVLAGKEGRWQEAAAHFRRAADTSLWGI